MSSRAEEKERRRQERLAREQEAQRAAARRRTLQIGGGVLLGIAVIAAVAVVVLAGGGSKNDSVDTTKLAADAKAAGCTFQSFPSEGRTHTASTVNYKTNPPTSGNHNPTPAQDGFYRAGNTPPKENFVHSLEHGRIEFQYKPGAPAAQVAQLRKLAAEPFNGSAGYHVLFFENNTKMPSEFAATAWTKSITCSQIDAQSIGAMREFRKAFTDKGPEFIP
jgi:Protein of unknown function (DUF3105)